MSDLVVAVLLLVGAVFSVTAGIGLLHFPDLLSRLHTGTKPQLVGLLMVLVAVGLRIGTPFDIGILVLIGAFQLMTAPVSAHMVGRAAYRAAKVHHDLLLTDELGRDLSKPP